MNDIKMTNTDDVKAFQLLSEFGDEQQVSQRELANRLGIAVGLVNSYIKNFVAKGYIRIKNYPHNRYGYLLTPHGMAEKARLAYQHINYFTNLYTVTRQDYLDLFRRLAASGVSGVSFCGVDEVAEIAWLSLRETGLELVGVMDDSCCGAEFMGKQVSRIDRCLLLSSQRVVITSLKRATALRIQLEQMQVTAEQIVMPGAEVMKSANKETM